MATSVRRKARTVEETVDPKSTFAEHILLKRQGSVITTRSEALKDRLKKWFLATDDDEVYENENGSKFFDFSETVSDGKEDFKGMELRRSQQTLFDEEIAERILKRKGVYEEALTPVLDQEKVYRLLAEGKITEADMDKILVKQEPKWSFYPVKGEVL